MPFDTSARGKPAADLGRPSSARQSPLSLQLLPTGHSADLPGDKPLRTASGTAAAAREKRALHMFERRLKEMSEASLRMIDAVVELRDARAAMQNQ